MSNVEQYTSIVPDWGTAKEHVIHFPQEEEAVIQYQQDHMNKTLFIMAIVTTPNGLSPPYLQADISLEGPRWNNEPCDEPNVYFAKDRSLAIINKPYESEWNVFARGSNVPFALHFLAFHPAIPPNSPPSPGPSGKSPFKCRACKSVAKALSLAIVAAATLPALPGALIAAVASYLGASIVIAAAFIASVIGDTADVISEKLCKQVGLC